MIRVAHALGCLALASCVALALVPERAHAFSSSVSFGLTPEESGGGGRYFTGSPADGYTCTVCHEGGQAPKVRVLGLPLSGYHPGLAYEVTVDWPDTLPHVALNVEITDQGGIGAGTLYVPPENELIDPERCEGTPFGAGQVMPILNRTLITMESCGAKQLRFLWVAPMVDRGALHFAGSMVSANDMQDVNGDGVTAFTRVLPSPRASAAKATEITGCSTVAPGASRTGHAALGASLLPLLAFGLRRQRMPRIKPRNASGST